MNTDYEIVDSTKGVYVHKKNNIILLPRSGTTETNYKVWRILPKEQKNPQSLSAAST